MRIEAKGEPALHVPCAPEANKLDPTGLGDAFRAGFLAALSWGLGFERGAQVGSLLAAHVIETIGTQEYELGQRAFLERLEEAYGAEAVSDVEPHLRCPRP